MMSSGSRAVATNSIVVQEQPKPDEVIDFGGFDELLEKNTKSTAGFEILADINKFEIKRREKKVEDYWESSWTYDIVGDTRQSLFLATKDIQWHCLPSASSETTVTAFTDIYKDAVFICRIQSTNQKQCCRVTTANKMEVGYVSSGGQGIGPYPCYDLTNALEGSNLQVIGSEGASPTTYDTWMDDNWVGSVTPIQKDHMEITTADSLSPASKILLLGFSFYLTSLPV